MTLPKRLNDLIERSNGLDAEDFVSDALPLLGEAASRLASLEADANEIAGEANAETVRLARLRRAAWQAMRELGVPDRDYPAPVANAYRILNEALGYMAAKEEQ